MPRIPVHATTVIAAAVILTAVLLVITAPHAAPLASETPGD